MQFESSQGLQKAVDMTGIEFQGKSLNIKINNAPIGGGGGRAPSRGGRGGGRGEALSLNGEPSTQAVLPQESQKNPQNLTVVISYPVTLL